MAQPRFSVIIVAGGTGSRMKSTVPKQFLTIASRPIIVHTVAQFYKASNDINVIIAAPAEHLETMIELMDEHFAKKNIVICTGGHTRFHSVQNALNHCSTDYVMVHDAVRPCINPDWIINVMSHVVQHNCAIPFVKMVDSVRQNINGKFEIIDRENIIRIQTPQGFNTELLKATYTQDFTDFTDDASVWESAGHQLSFIAGLEKNIKITTFDDLIMATHFLEDNANIS